VAGVSVAIREKNTVDGGINGGGSRSPTGTTGPARAPSSQRHWLQSRAAAQRPQRQGRPTSEATVGGVGSSWRLCDGFRGEGRLTSIGTGDKASRCQGRVLTLRWGREGHIDTGHLTRCKLHTKEIQVYNSLIVYIYILHCTSR
jgi:hypothetical protein